MRFTSSALDTVLCGATLAALCAVGSSAAANPPAKAAKPAHSKPAKKAPVKVDTGPAAAGPEQIDAAERVYYGKYDCEFKQTVDVEKDAKHSAYVDVKHGKAAWVMKPVLSSTGAIRLEDVKGETLMVQIASKSMLLNVKTARRIVDDCVSPTQRELVEATKIAKAAAESASGAASGSVPASAAGSAADAAAPASAPLATGGTSSTLLLTPEAASAPK